MVVGWGRPSRPRKQQVKTKERAVYHLAQELQRKVKARDVVLVSNSMRVDS